VLAVESSGRESRNEIVMYRAPMNGPTRKRQGMVDGCEFRCGDADIARKGAMRWRRRLLALQVPGEGLRG
jgi:hypothetical protein